MAGMYEVDQKIKIQDVGNRIYAVQSMTTPFMRLVPRGPRAKNKLASWTAKSYGRRGRLGIPDGQDQTTYSKQEREELQGTAMILRSDGWQVSQTAAVTENAAIGRREVAEQKADDALLFGQQMERQVLSDADCILMTNAVAGSSRGVFKWLATAAQTLYPVPAAFRPPSASVYTGTLAAYTPAQMEAQLKSMATERRSPVDLLNLCGIQLKSRMSKWAQRDTNVSGETFVQQYNLDAKEKAFLQCVDFFHFDAGEVKAMTSYYLLTDDDGEDTAYTPRSGALLDMDMWRIRYMQEERSVENPDLGGGRRGFHDSIFRLECGNPRAQGYQYISADS